MPNLLNMNTYLPQRRQRRGAGRARKRRPGARVPHPPYTIGPVPSPRGPGSPQPGPAPGQPARGDPTLPLDPIYEQGRRGLEDQLAAQLMGLTSRRGQVQPMLDLNLARLGTAQGLDERRTNEGAAARGIYDSGIRTRDLGLVRDQYGRQRQDFGLEATSLLSALAGEESQANLGYQQGLSQLLFELAQRTAEDPSAPIMTEEDLPGGGGGGGKGKRRRRRGQNRKRNPRRRRPVPPRQWLYGG